MYKLVEMYGEIVSVMRLSDNSCIPFDEDNVDYQQYQAWLAQGNKPLPPEGAK